MTGRKLSILAGSAILSAVIPGSFAEAQATLPPPAVDITNRSRTISEMVDVYGIKTASNWFSISRVCNILVRPDRYTGSKVHFKIQNVNGTKLLTSIIGTQNRREVKLPPGRYEFVIIAWRDAGYYTFELESHCE